MGRNFDAHSADSPRMGWILANTRIGTGVSRLGTVAAPSPSPRERWVNANLACLSGTRSEFSDQAMSPAASWVIANCPGLRVVQSARGRELDSELLDQLLARYDVASESGKEAIIEEAIGSAGGRVAGMLRRKLGQFPAMAEELNSWAAEALRDALEGAGRTRFLRTDIVPEVLVEEMRRTQTGQRLWEMLSPELQSELSSARYIKQDLAQRLANELNELLDEPDLSARFGVNKAPTASSRKRTAENAALMSKLFTEAIRQPKVPEGSMVGYLAKSVLPTLRNRVIAERGGRSPDTMKAWGAISPIIEEMRAKLGHPPTPEEVHAEQKRRMADRYGSTIQWWEEQIQKVQPDNAFRLKDPQAYRDAQDILAHHGYDPVQWSGPTAPRYLPKEALKPYGIGLITRLMRTPGLGAPRGQGPRPAPQRSGPSGGGGDELGYVGQSGGELYRSVIDRLYAKPGYEAERAVGEFLAQKNQNPNPKDIERFLASIDPQVAADIRDAGWENLVRTIDDKVLEMVRDPGARADLAGKLNAGPSALTAALNAVRETITARRTGVIVRLAS